MWRLFVGIQIPIDSDIHALSTLEDVQYATEHGVYVVNKETVRDGKEMSFGLLTMFF